MNPPPTPIIAARIPTSVPRTSGISTESRTPDRLNSICQGSIFSMRAYDDSFLTSGATICRLGLAHRLKTLGEHVAPDDSEHEHIGEIDQEIGIAELPKDLDDLNSHRSPDDPADQEQQAHFEIDVAETKMRKGAGCRGPDDLVRIRSRRHSRGNAEHY